MSNPIIAAVVVEPPTTVVMVLPQKRLKNLLETLSGLVKTLPTSIPNGQKDGPIAKQFTSKDYDLTEGPYFTFNKAWERVFQVSPDEKEQ
jgi:hypothetical protein